MESVIQGSLALALIASLPTIAIAGLFLVRLNSERIRLKVDRERLLEQVRIARGGTGRRR